MLSHQLIENNQNSIDNKVDSSENKGIVIGSQHRGLGKR